MRRRRTRCEKHTRPATSVWVRQRTPFRRPARWTIGKGGGLRRNRPPQAGGTRLLPHVAVPARLVPPTTISRCCRFGGWCDFVSCNRRALCSVGSASVHRSVGRFQVVSKPWEAPFRSWGSSHPSQGPRGALAPTRPPHLWGPSRLNFCIRHQPGRAQKRRPPGDISQPRVAGPTRPPPAARRRLKPGGDLPPPETGGRGGVRGGCQRRWRRSWVKNSAWARVWGWGGGGTVCKTTSQGVQDN